ncbi:hypothetical protein AAHA92_06585 [Salvia divinorum]|uniref:Uncharacterized protein n=1 Tax=Salvia divinorum TaxID=28513 RepID=A0ABD1I764_SALDI
MNCNFLETEFFYHTHLNSQGVSDQGSPDDCLSWVVPLPSSSIEYSTDPVVTTAEQVSPQESPQPLPPDPSQSIPSDNGQYVLPPRSTLGILPKRYFPERIGKNSRYGVANFVQGNITKMT